jgi:L,D-transpeptidase catalytic domain
MIGWTNGAKGEGVVAAFATANTEPRTRRLVEAPLQNLASVAPLDFLRVLRIKTPSKIMERSFVYLLHGVLSIGLVLLVTGCGEDPRFSGNTQYLGGVYGGEQGGGPPRDTVSYWDGDHASGSPSIKISLGEQRAYFYKSGVLVGVSQLSTGREGLNTPTGSFKITQKDKDHVSSLFGDYVDSSGKVVVPNVEVKKDPKPPGTHFQGTPMPYFMRIVSGTGLHAGYLPGYPASHGCIRMPEFMAENFFRSVSVGTPVTITH